MRAALKRAGGPIVCPVIVISPADVEADAPGIAVNLGRATVFAGDRCVVVDTTGGETSGGEALNVGQGGEPDTLASVAVWKSLEDLERDYQTVIIATTPVLSGPSSSTLSEHAAAVVLLVLLGQSRRSKVHQAAKSSTGVGAQVVGVLAVR